jgi:hypothetical protein
MKLVACLLVLIVAKLSMDESRAEAMSALKFEAKKNSNEICPDKSECPGDETCCSLGDETYGCCPFAQAVCCSDYLHCCPNGKICNVAAGTCDSTFEKSLPWGRKN